MNGDDKLTATWAIYNGRIASGTTWLTIAGEGGLLRLRGTDELILFTDAVSELIDHASVTAAALILELPAVTIKFGRAPASGRFYLAFGQNELSPEEDVLRDVVAWLCACHQPETAPSVSLDTISICETDQEGCRLLCFEEGATSGQSRLRCSSADAGRLAALLSQGAAAAGDLIPGANQLFGDLELTAPVAASFELRLNAPYSAHRLVIRSASPDVAPFTAKLTSAGLLRLARLLAGGH